MEKKYHSTLTLLLLLFPIALSESEPLNGTTYSQHPIIVAFDIGGVLFTKNTTKALEQIGLTDTAAYAWEQGISPFNIGTTIKQRFYDILHLVQPMTKKQSACPCDDEGVPLPQLMCDWLSGTDSEQIRDLIINKANSSEASNWFSSPLEKDIITRVVSMTFTPKQFASIWELIGKAEQFVRQCKKRGFRLCIFSNWDADSFKILTKTHRSFFQLFNTDDIICSGEKKCVKPEQNAYQKLIETVGKNHTIVFIDDQEENIKAAKKMGMNAILYRPTKLCGFERHDFSHIERNIAQLERTNTTNKHRCA